MEKVGNVRAMWRRTCCVVAMATSEAAAAASVGVGQYRRDYRWWAWPTWFAAGWVWRHPFIIAPRSGKHVRGPCYVIKSRDIADGTPSCRRTSSVPSHTPHRASRHASTSVPDLRISVRCQSSISADQFTSEAFFNRLIKTPRPLRPRLVWHTIHIFCWVSYTMHHANAIIMHYFHCNFQQHSFGILWQFPYCILMYFYSYYYHRYYYWHDLYSVMSSRDADQGAGYPVVHSYKPLNEFQCILKQSYADLNLYSTHRLSLPL